MTTLVRTYWHPERLNAAIAAAFPSAAKAAQDDAKARLHEKQRSDVGLRVTSANTAQLQPQGLASLFEHGRRPGYAIVPKEAQALKIGTQGFAARAVGGPMRSYPALGPAARDWALGGYQGVARRILGAAGFGRLL